MFLGWFMVACLIIYRKEWLTIDGYCVYYDNNDLYVYTVC